MAFALELNSDGGGYTFLWQIENYNFFHPERGKCIRSPDFFVNVIGPIHLELYPRGDLFDNENYVILCLCSTTSLFNQSFEQLMHEYSVDCKLTLKNESGEFAYAKEEVCDALRWKFKKIEPPSPKRKIVDDSLMSMQSTLVIKCQLSLNMKDGDISEDIKDVQILSEEMGFMCCNTNLSDFTLVFKDKEFPLHKAVLYARVPKLAEELKFETSSEAVLSNATLDNIVTTDVLKHFLTYIYTGKVPLLTTETVCGLSLLSELYDVTSLKKLLCYYPNGSTGRTLIKVDRKLFTWSIKNFDKIKPGEQIPGPVFSSGTIPSADLQFIACIEETSDGAQDVRITVCRLSPDKSKSIFVGCKLKVMNFTADTIYSYSGNHNFQSDVEWKLPSFIRMKKIDDKGIYRLDNRHVLCLRGKNFLLNVVFFISGQELVTEVVSTDCLVRVANSYNDIKSLSSDLRKLYNIFLPKLSDVTLHVGDVKFPAHMVVLSARSPVFSRMFEHEMLERKLETVFLSDVDVATLNLLLTYLYSGKIDVVLSFENAIKLYTACDKYDIASLRDKCSDTLKEFTTDSNVCNLFVHADMHSDKKLRTFAKDYICRKSNVVLKLPEWKELLNDRLELAIEIIQEMTTLILHHKESCVECLSGISPS